MKQTLPDRLRRKVAALALIADEARDSAKGTADRLHRVELEVEKLERRRRDVTSTRSLTPTPGRSPTEDRAKMLAEVDADLADAKRQRDELRGLRREREERSMAARAVHRRVERLIADHGSRLADVEPPEPDLAPAETLADALERIRAELPPLRDKLAETRAAGLPAKDLKAKIKAHVAALAEEGRPRLEERDGGVSILWPGLGAERGTVWEANNPSQSPAAFLAWLDPALLIARLGAEIDAMPRDGLTLSAEDKAAQVADLEAQLLAAERAEEALVERATAEGFAVTRRPDADPRAVLGVEFSDAAEKKEAA